MSNVKPLLKSSRFLILSLEGVDFALCPYNVYNINYIYIYISK